jgi:hypothetical protein
LWPGVADRSAISAVMPSPAFLGWSLSGVVVERGRGLLSVGGPRWTARTRCTGPSQARTSAPQDRPADRGPSRAHPVTGGAGEQRTGVSAAHKRASTSANSAATSGSSRWKACWLGPSMASLLAGATTVSRCVFIASNPGPHWPADQALMTLWRLPRPIEILRGFAFSATGIRSRSTPPS